MRVLLGHVSRIPHTWKNLKISDSTNDARQFMQNQTELGFFKSLFDFKMTSFITMRVIRLFYVISTIVILIFPVILIIIAIFGNSGPGLLLIVVLSPISTLLSLIIVRLWVEFLANLYRIGDNTQKMVDAIPTV